MVDPNKVDEILAILNNNTDNNHITTVEYVCEKVFKNDKAKCYHTIDYMVTLGFIKFVKGSTRNIQLEYVGKATYESGGYVNEIKESERQRTIEKEKEERKEIESLLEQKKNRRAIYWSGIISAVIGALLSNLDRIVPWLKSLLVP